MGGKFLRLNCVEIVKFSQLTVEMNFFHSRLSGKFNCNFNEKRESDEAFFEYELYHIIIDVIAWVISY